jgi:hypothetical protein
MIIACHYPLLPFSAFLSSRSEKNGADVNLDRPRPSIVDSYGIVGLGKKSAKPRLVYTASAMLPPVKGMDTRNANCCRFRNRRSKFPHLQGMVSSMYRHSFVTDALENGVGVAQVAELLGHARLPASGSLQLKCRWEVRRVSEGRSLADASGSQHFSRNGPLERF